MADRKQWEHFIRQGNWNRIERIRKRLFIDMEQTSVFLQGMVDVLRSKNRPTHFALLRENIRGAVLELSVDRLNQVLICLNVLDEFRTIVFILFGTKRDDGATAKIILERLVPIGETERMVISEVDRNSMSARFTLCTLAAAASSDGTYTWTNMLTELHKHQDVVLLRRLIECFTFHQMDFAIVPYKKWDASTRVLQSVEGQTHVRFPVPDDLESWVQDEHRKYEAALAAQAEGLAQLIHALREREAECRSIYEDMWLEMMVQPRWALREGGLDAVRIAIPEFCEAGYTNIRLTPHQTFPHFRALFHCVHMNGNVELREMDLEPSDLLQCGRRSPWFERLFALLAVHAAWRIIMGRESREEPGAGTQRPNGGAIIRARFRHLPEGHRASPEARERALRTFRQIPLPGFTFVRQYERGNEPQSGEPLFSLVDILPG